MFIFNVYFSDEADHSRETIFALLSQVDEDKAQRWQDDLYQSLHALQASLLSERPACNAAQHSLGHNTYLVIHDDCHVFCHAAGPGTLEILDIIMPTYHWLYSSQKLPMDGIDGLDVMRSVRREGCAPL